jgi:hypothetical protein
MNQETISTPLTPLPSKNNDGEWKNVLSILLLILLTPIGLILMWLVATWTKKTKIIITIVLLAILILAGLIPAIIKNNVIDSARSSARDSKVIADIREIQSALAIYSTDNAGLYPASNGNIILNRQCISKDGGISNSCAGTVYMSSVPGDPLDFPNNPLDSPKNKNCSTNNYVYSSDSKDYTIKFCLSSEVSGLIAGEHQATSRGIDK